MNRFIVFVLFFVLMGCSADKDDLVQYIQSVKSRPVSDVKPLPLFASLSRIQGSKFKFRRNPFEPLSHKHPLEQVPLDSLKLVGVLVQNLHVWALIEQPNGAVVRLGMGASIGNNGGRVRLIENNFLEVEELIQGSSRKQRIKIFMKKENMNPDHISS